MATPPEKAVFKKLASLNNLAFFRQAKLFQQDQARYKHVMERELGRAGLDNVANDVSVFLKAA